jgi:hypothetical protein
VLLNNPHKLAQHVKRHRPSQEQSPFPSHLQIYITNTITVKGYPELQRKQLALETSQRISLTSSFYALMGLLLLQLAILDIHLVILLTMSKHASKSITYHPNSLLHHAS